MIPMSEMDKEFQNFEDELFDTLMERNPHMATHLGIHKYDHLLPNGSREKHLEDIQFMETAIEKLKGFDPERLSQENRFARKVGLHLLTLFLFNERKLRYWEKKPSVPSIIGSSIFPLLKREFAPFEKRFESIKSRVEAIPDFVEEAKSTLVDPVKLWVEMGVESIEQLPMLFKLVTMIATEEGIDDEKLDEFSSAVDQADAALEGYKNWLERLLPEASNDFSVGEELFKELLDLRELGYSSDEILRLGEEYMDSTLKKMDKYAAEIDPDLDKWKVLENVNSKLPSDFEEALGWYSDGLDEAKEFVIDNDLCTIPQNEKIEVSTTPEYLRHIIPFAAYMGPAKFDEIKKGIYLVTPPKRDADWKKMSYWDIRNTTVHEGYPGHHLQISCSTEVDNMFVFLSHATETIEGWAHYCEEMMKEHGFDDTPEARLVQARDILWRAARIIVDVKLSTGKMEFDEAVEFLVDKVGLEERAAEAEVKRYTQNPAYQLSYLLGKHMIMEIREDVKNRYGDDFSEKGFHDTILYSGSVPLKFLKKEIERRMRG